MPYTSRSTYEFLSTQNNDPIVERKICAISGVEFPIYQSDVEFFKKIALKVDGKIFEIPFPTLCPEERLRRRLSFRNERKLFKRYCDFSGKEIISMYPPKEAMQGSRKIYDNAIRWSDQRDPMQYGKQFDSSKTFTEQFQQLLHDVPRCSLLTVYKEQENAAYTNLAGPAKDCYLTFEMDRCDNVMYSYVIYDCKDCLDCSYVIQSQQCFECHDINNSFAMYRCQQCYDSNNCFYSKNCSNCHHCFGCENLVGASYMIYNQQYSKEDYEKTIKNLVYEGGTLKYHSTQAMNVVNGSGAIAGNFIKDCKDTTFCYDIVQSRDCKYCGIMNNAQDCMDHFSRGEHASLTYEMQNCGLQITKSAFCNFVWDQVDNIYYSDNCTKNCSHLFGCVGLRGKSYCIFNMQYSKEEYEKEISKIIARMQETGEWGEFFHPSLSPFGYNDTVAQEYFPQTPSATPYPPYQGEKDNLSLPPGQGRGIACGGGFDELEKFGYHRSDYSSDPKIPETVAVIHPGDYSDEAWKHLETDPDITKKIFVCMESKRPYRILQQELDFYTKHQLALPKYHPDIRHSKRLVKRSGRTLDVCRCSSCGIKTLSVARNTDEKILCVACFQKVMYA